MLTSSLKMSASHLKVYQLFDNTKYSFGHQQIKAFIQRLIDQRHIPVQGAFGDANRWSDTIASFHKNLARCYLENTNPRLQERHHNKGIMDNIDEPVDHEAMVVTAIDLRTIPTVLPIRSQSYPPAGPPTKAMPSAPGPPPAKPSEPSQAAPPKNKPSPPASSVASPSSSVGAIPKPKGQGLPEAKAEPSPKDPPFVPAVFDANSLAPTAEHHDLEEQDAKTDDAWVVSVNTSAGKTLQCSEAQTEELPELLPLELLPRRTK